MPSSSLRLPLPGRLGDPTLTLITDPRLDPRLAAALGGTEAVAGKQAPVGPDSPYEEILGYIGAAESELDGFYAEMFGSLPPVDGVIQRSDVIKGIDGNEIRLFIHEPAERSQPLPGILHTHGGAMVMVFEPA